MEQLLGKLCLACSWISVTSRAHIKSLICLEDFGGWDFRLGVHFLCHVFRDPRDREWNSLFFCAAMNQGNGFNSHQESRSFLHNTFSTFSNFSRSFHVFCTFFCTCSCLSSLLTKLTGLSLCSADRPSLCRSFISSWMLQHAFRTFGAFLAVKTYFCPHKE